MRSHSRKPISEINVVPYIDVMLVLLVIFMVTTPMLTQGVDIDLPQTVSQVIDTTQEEPIIISVDSRGRYFLNVSQHPQDVISPEALSARIAAEVQLAKRQHRQLVPVMVKGDRYVAYGQVVQAMSLIQQAGVAKVGLMTEEPKKRRAP